MATDLEYGAELRKRIEPAIVGVGPIESAIGTALRLQRLADGGHAPDLVVSLGSAGSRCLPLGSVHQISSVSWRDMDARRLGFEKGVTPFADHPVRISLPVPLDGVPVASLSTGGNVIGGADYHTIDCDLVDMETFAVVRACQRFGVPVIGLRAVSDGEEELTDIGGWTRLLEEVDAHLAQPIDLLPAALHRLRGTPK